MAGDYFRPDVVMRLKYTSTLFFAIGFPIEYAATIP